MNTTDLIVETTNRFSPDALIALVIFIILMWSALRAFDIYMKLKRPEHLKVNTNGNAAQLVNLKLIESLTLPISSAVRALNENVEALQMIITKLGESLDNREKDLQKTLLTLHKECSYCPREERDVHPSN